MAAYGSMERPVSLDPFATIKEVGWPNKADIIVIRCGVDLPTGVGAHLPVVFRRIAPAKRTTAEPHQSHALSTVVWVGKLTGGTTVTPANAGGKVWRNEPAEPGGAFGIEVTGSTFPLQIPSTDQWGAKDDGYNPGSYLWAAGWSSGLNQPNNNCCLINARKLRHDFEIIKEPPEKNTKLAGIVIAAAFNAVAESSGSLTNLMVEFAAYRFTPGFQGSGDFFTTTHGMVYANAVKMIARKVVKPNAILLRRVDFTYDLKKTITFSGGTEISAAAYGAFTNQPGG